MQQTRTRPRPRPTPHSQLGFSQSPPTPPLPPLKEPAKTLNEEFSTTVAYAILISNGNAKALCKAINTTSLSKVSFINGTAVKTEVCSAARIGQQSRESESAIISLNQEWAKYLVTAVYAVDVAGGFAGGTDLKNLKNRIEVVVINNLFIGYKDDRKVGQEVKDYVRNAAAAEPPPLVPTPALSNTPNTTTTPTLALPNCTYPQGLTNTIVPLPPKFAADGHIQIPRPYNDAHQLIITIDPDLSLSEASIATSYLEECVVYSSDGKKCKSIFANYEISVPAQNGGEAFLSGSDPDEVK